MKTDRAEETARVRSRHDKEEKGEKPRGQQNEKDNENKREQRNEMILRRKIGNENKEMIWANWHFNYFSRNLYCQTRGIREIIYSGQPVIMATEPKGEQWMLMIGRR